MYKTLLAAALALLLAQQGGPGTNTTGPSGGPPGGPSGPSAPSPAAPSQPGGTTITPPTDIGPGYMGPGYIGPGDTGQGMGQTGRGGIVSPQPGDTTGRAPVPGCPPPDSVTGRGGVCRPSETLPRTGIYEEPTPRAPGLGPERPTGPEPGDYPRTFPPYGSETGGVPAPYGPGLGNGRTVRPQGR